MKKAVKSFITMLLVVSLLMSNFAMIFSFAAIENYPVELAFNNLFVLDNWASNKLSTTIATESDGQNRTDKLDINLETGTVVFKNPYTGGAYTGFSMENVDSKLIFNRQFYTMEVEPGATYTFSYNVTQNTQGVVPYVFYFDEDFRYIDLNADVFSGNGNRSFDFTTPGNCRYIQMRFTVKNTGTATFKDIFISKKFAGTTVSTGYDHRRIYNYSSSNPTTYGALPVPTDVPAGYVFAGWYTGVNGTGERITENTVVKHSSMSVYPKFDPAIDSLSIKTNAAKTTYSLGERVNLTGLVLEAKVGSTTYEINEGFHCTPEYLTATGAQTVTVHYGGKTATYTVNVDYSVPESITFNGVTHSITIENNVYQINKLLENNNTFNHYKLTYYSDAYVRGIIKYEDSSTEEFFLEPSSNFDRADGNGEFSSYVDGYLTKVLNAQHDIAKVTSECKGGIVTISFELLDNKAGNFELLSVETSVTNPMNPEITGDNIMAQTLKLFNNDKYKVGIDILNGGVVSFLSVLDSNIEARVYTINGVDVTKVDYADKLDATYGTNYKSKNTDVNLINYYDTGRYLQQSYYGTNEKPYETGSYNGNDQWNYNPVQGGNVVGEASKVIDYKIGEDYIYVKTRPLDWAKWSDDFANKVSNDDYEPKYGNDEYKTDTYVESKYVFEDGMIKVYNRKVDYSGLPSAVTTQELPAFYTIEPLNNYVRTNVDTAEDAWTFNAELEYISEPEFWGVTGEYVENNYPNGFTVDTYTPENWGAFMASTDADSFGIGIYSPESTDLCYGVYPAKYSGLPSRHADTVNPAYEDNTSYIAPMGVRTFESYSPSEYSYYISTGTATQIRNSFGVIDSDEFAAELEEQQAKGSVVVPETVYMTPSTGASTTGQYYVNNVIDTSSYTVTTEASNNKTSGYVQLYIPDAKSVTYTVNYKSGTNVGDVIASGENTAHKFDANGYLALNSTTISVGTGLSANQTATVEWKFTVTMNNGTTRTYYAYTTLYAPNYHAVGATAETSAKSKYVDIANSGISGWVTGIHSSDVSKYNTFGGDTPGNQTGDGVGYFKNEPLMNLDTVYPGQMSTSDDLVTKVTLSGNNAYVRTYWYGEASNGNAKSMQVNSFLGLLTVDKSRYSNLNSIPNLYVGAELNNVDNGEDRSWEYFKSWYTLVENSAFQGQSVATQPSDWTNWVNFYPNTFSRSSTSKFILASNGTPYTRTYSKYNDFCNDLNNGRAARLYDTLNLDISGVNSSSTYYIYAMVQTCICSRYNSNNQYDGYANTYTSVKLDFVDKTSLRELVVQGASFNESNYSTDSWYLFKEALAAAAAVLGNPTATATQITEAYNNLKTHRDNLGTYVYFHTGVETGTVNLLDNSAGNGTAVAVLGLGADTIWVYDEGDYTMFPATRNDGSDSYYTFMGWATSPDTDYRDTDKYFTQANENNVDMYGGFNQNFYAVWKEHSYTVKLDANGGVNTVADKTVKYTESFRLPTVTECTREGYRLIGWATDKNAAASYTPGQTLSSLTTTDNSTITLYAVWAQNSYTVAFDANGGSGSAPSVNVTGTASITLPSTAFTKTGYTLLGWSTDKSATAATYTPGQSVNNLAASGTVTLYAVWAENSYTVNFNANGGTGTSSATVKFTQTVTLPTDSSVTREGYTLLGWSTEADATSASYTPGQTVSGLTATNGDSFTFYAVWKENINIVDDTVVIDFGLPVDINVLENDTVAENGSITGIKTADGNATTEALELTYGTAALNGQSIIYTPASTNMRAEDVFFYVYEADGKEFIAKVTVVPATSIYYEESFMEFTNKGNYVWVDVKDSENTEIKNIFQSDDRPGEDSAYGSDAAYNDSIKYSLGTAKKTTVDSKSVGSEPEASFTFSGTGFDLYSVTSNETGAIRVQIFKAGSRANEDKIKDYLVNTYYGYTGTGDGLTPDADSTAALYQVPVISTSELDYDTYDVVIKPIYTYIFDPDYKTDDGYSIYVDSVRIFNPADLTPDPDSTIGDIYLADGEYSPVYKTVRELLIAPAENITLEGANGSFFLDGASDSTVTDYKKQGPKNEVYLAKGQAIAFMLSASDIASLATLNLGAKVIDGGTGSISVAHGTNSLVNISINGATEQFYGLNTAVSWLDAATGKTTYPVIITNTSDAVVSLTSFKWGHKATEASAVSFMVYPDTAMLAMRAMSSIMESAEITEESVTVEWGNDSFITGETATLYVTTPESVMSVWVDGVDMEEIIAENGTKLWSCEIVPENAGETTFTIDFLTDFIDPVLTLTETILVEAAPVEEEATEEETTETIIPDEEVTEDAESDGESNEEDSSIAGSIKNMLDLIFRFFRSIIELLRGLAK